MELGMREWLILGGVVLVLIVLVDGLRRMRRERSGGLKMSLGLGGGFTDADEYGPELPNGGARIVNRSEPTIESSPVNLDSGIGMPQPGAMSASGGDAARFMGSAELLVMHAKSPDPGGFNGSDLLQVLLACDLRYGDRDILHRHEQADGQGSLQFSVANMLEPGTFSLEDINSFRTPGVTFFMTLSEPDDPSQAFECMVETANCLVKNLGAQLLDEDHNPASSQVVNHYRDRVGQYLQRLGRIETA